MTNFTDLNVPDAEAFESQLLAYEPDGLNIDGGLPVLRPGQLKQGVIA